MWDLPGMERVLDVIADRIAAWDFLVEESPFINPHEMSRPIDALKAGKIDLVVAAAHSYLEAYT